MKVTVNDCLGLEAFSPSILAAGKRNIGNRVRSVSVMDASNVETALKNNGVREQIVLTSFYGMTVSYTHLVILEDACWESPAMEDEIFGPILPVITYDRLDEAKSEIEKRPRPLAL